MEIFEKNESRILKKVNSPFYSKFDPDSENSQMCIFISKTVAQNVK